ncbi:MAG: transporter [Chlorobiaceae bacterium]|nr:transporter [Chlorobiaceae bacterium]HWR00324.1 EamA family transporter [Chlorobaculum sp.]
MTVFQILLLLATVFLISVGQILFKMTANELSGVDFSSASSLVKVFTPILLLALSCYALSTAMWIGVLRITPLNKAYPFVALAFVIVPFLSRVFVGEHIRWTTIAGAVIILIGVLVSSIN